MPLVAIFSSLFFNFNLKENNFYNSFNEKIEVILEGKIYEYTNDKYYLKLNKLNTNEIIYINDDKILINNLNDNIKIGQVIKIKGTLKKFQKASNMGQFDEFNYYRTKNLKFKIDVKEYEIINNRFSIYKEFLRKLKDKICNNYDKLLEIKYSGIIKAILLGEKSDLDTDLKVLYQQNGIAHILAISGLHISLIGLSFYKLFRKFGVSFLLSGVFTAIFLVSYGILTGSSISTVRAIIMIFILIIADIIGRGYDIISATSFTAILLLLQNPFLLFSTSFLLSFSAVFSIAFVVPIMKKGIDKKILNSFISSLSISLVTTPIIINTYYEFPLYSVILNVIVIPLMSILVIFSIFGGIIGMFNITFGKMILLIPKIILIIYESLCNIFLKLPFSNIVTGHKEIYIIVVYYIFLVIFLLARYKQQIKIQMFSIVLLIGFLIISSNTEFKIVMLDVGQGDGIFIQTDDKKIF